MANSHIISFIQGLSSTEVRLVEEHLSKTQSLFEGTNSEAMEVKLFKFLVANNKKSISDADIIKATSTKRVTDLKNNLFNKVLEALTLDKYITNPTLFAENDIIVFELKKKLLICKISLRTLNQNKTEYIQELLNEIIDKGKEFELYDILVEALTAKKYFKGNRIGLKEFEAINTELEFYQYCYLALINATDNYFRLILNNDFIKTFTNIEAHIKSSIDKMALDYEKTNSEQINYYLHIMRFALYERQKDYTSAVNQCNMLIAILKKNKVIYREERMGFAYTNLAQYKTFLNNYSDALKDTKKAQQLFLEDSFNHAISKELEFYINFYNESYSNANKCLNALLSHSRLDTGEFRRSKYIYYHACVLFAEGNFKGALLQLHESLEMEKDKSRWNISLRVLNIMIFIELNKIDEAFSSLESLRKYIERTGKNSEVSKRDLLIVKLLRELEKSGFQYKPENAVTKKMVEQLSETTGELAWEYFSSELIPFHKWVVKNKE